MQYTFYMQKNAHYIKSREVLYHSLGTTLQNWLNFEQLRKKAAFLFYLYSLASRFFVAFL